MTPLDTILRDASVPMVLGRYLSEGADELTTRYERFLSQLASRRFVVPVAGVQGSGKSTLLNALAFGSPVLPTDADETTCVPVEIGFSAEPEGQALVRFANGDEVRVPATEASIAEFVHNDRNPGNEKKVDRVVVSSNRPLLKDGLVLVDLPGTGSLTASNIETTLRYLRESVGVVFLLRTVPPITKSESHFVASHWVRLPAAFFVQNRWTDETEVEAEAGRQHNQTVLRQLAERKRIRIDGNVKIHVVTAYQALRGRLASNMQDLEASGLIGLEEELSAFAKAWPTLLRAAVQDALSRDLWEGLAVVERRREEVVSDRVELQARLNSEEVRFDAYIKDVESRCDAARRDVQSFSTAQGERIDQWRGSAASELRNRMRTKLRQGIVDGARLSKALRDEVSEEADEIFEVVQENLLSFQDKLRDSFADVPEWRPRRGNSTVSVDRPARTKWESLAKPLLGGGAAVGGAIGGPKAGAALGAWLGTSVGPVGTVVVGIVGGVVGGVVGGLFGAWAGRKTRVQVVLRRANAAEPEVFNAVGEFVDGTRADLLEQVGQFQRGIDEGLDGWVSKQKACFEAEREKKRASLYATREEREATLATLDSDHAAIAGWTTTLGEEAK